MITDKKTFRDAMTASMRTARIMDRLENDHGINIAFVRHLDRLSNVETCWGGHLKNATMHYVNRWELSGKTYDVKEYLKARGFRWDRAKRVWWRAADEDFDATELGAILLRILKGDK